MKQLENLAHGAMVFTRDPDLYDLITILLAELGCDSAAMKEDAPSARLLVVDLDSRIDRVPPETASLRPRVVGISARGDDIDNELKSRCDAILHRPVGFAEFRHTIRSVLECGAKSAALTQNLSPSFFLDKKEFRVSSNDASVKLTPNEFTLLATLTEKRGEPVSRSELSALILDDGQKSNSVDVYICTLRAKLENAFGTRLISTVRGKGYAIK